MAADGPKMVTLWSEDFMGNPGEDKWWNSFLHRAKPFLHALLEPFAKRRQGPNHEIVYVDKHDTNDPGLLQSLSMSQVKEVMIMDTLNETELVSEEMQ